MNTAAEEKFRKSGQRENVENGFGKHEFFSNFVLTFEGNNDKITQPH
ncbi:hypothetical protein KQI10_01735 [Pseudoflavonifractor sp. MSJ-30]|nr:hypothetical protein [Pseudoflavonifractor sp. MSJ-30]